MQLNAFSVALREAACATVLDIAGQCDGVRCDMAMLLINRVFAQTSVPVRNLIGLLVRRGRIEQLPRVAEEFRRLDDQRQGIVHATATSALPLNDTEIRALTARLEQMTGGRVALQTDVDESLLGGLVVRVGSRLIDASVRGRLERLRNQLAAGTI